MEYLKNVGEIRGTAYQYSDSTAVRTEFTSKCQFLDDVAKGHDFYAVILAKTMPALEAYKGKRNFRETIDPGVGLGGGGVINPLGAL